MTNKKLSEKIHFIDKKIIDGFLTMDEKTHGFYNGQKKVYEEWLGSLNSKK
ncbi:hypothetical protein [Psychroserpens burtonensis]|uniref:hypothetical protein n=1 Tax=Psychroserpens burtonensis TaxID=49278 RepID=UPI00164CB838|nr:hypothetical protein [Psychroserpens burtonensis]